MKSRTIIKADSISIGYQKSRYNSKSNLYNDLSFSLYKGELVCLLGSNGAGKSTLIRTICGSQPSLKGNIFLENKNITSYSEKELSRLLGLVLTDKTSIGGLLVKELVELGRYPYTGFFGHLTQQDKDIAKKAMEDVCIMHKADSYVAELSDGERQKVMIAKALAQECPIVLLDEPTAFLDIETFDTNRLTEYYSLGLKRAAILKYDYYSYLCFMRKIVDRKTSLEELTELVKGLFSFMDSKMCLYWQGVIEYNYKIQKHQELLSTCKLQFEPNN